MSKEEAHKRSFKRVKEDVGKMLSHPLLRPSLEEALRFPLLEQKEQEAMFGFLVEENAQRCLFGVPEDEITGEYMCNYLIESVDHLAHARPALERAVDLYVRENKDLMPPCLREWIKDPGEPPKRRGGPRPEAQDWTALHDQIVAMAIGFADRMQRNRAWQEILPIGRACSSEDEWKYSYSICRAVVEVLKERYGDDPDSYYLPTCHTLYNSAFNAWQRDRQEDRNKVNKRRGRTLRPPGGLDSLIRPEGMDTEPMQRKFNKRSDAHLFDSALRDPDDHQ